MVLGWPVRTGRWGEGLVPRVTRGEMGESTHGTYR